VKKQLFGPGQGSTLSQFLWLLLFILIVTSIEPHMPRINLQSANSTVVIDDIGEAFVDDSLLGCTTGHVADTTLSDEENRILAEHGSLM
jgi:hypothetical protein